MTTLTNRALLVSLNISQWTARKLDRRETAELTLKHGLMSDAARVNKTLLPFATSLERVHKATGAIRTFYYAKTLPWSDGQQIMCSNAYLQFTSEINVMLDEWRSNVDQFIEDYPELKRDAQRTLNGLYKEDDYPDVRDIRRKFNIDLSFMPVPDANDWRVDLGDEHVDYLRASITEQVQRAQGQAMSQAWERIYKVVSAARERLASPDAIFRDSLIENARELCALLPGLNITEDPALERMRQEVEGTLCKYNPDTLRKDPAVRSQVADDMADIMSRMGAFYRPE